MAEDLLKYFIKKDTELRVAVNACYPAKNKISSKEPSEKRHWNSNFGQFLRMNAKNFGTNYKIED